MLPKVQQGLLRLLQGLRLDSMPGKQMAIDADLNAGFIDDKEAQERRKALILKQTSMGQWMDLLSL